MINIIYQVQVNSGGGYWDKICNTPFFDYAEDLRAEYEMANPNMLFRVKEIIFSIES